MLSEESKKLWVQTLQTVMPKMRQQKIPSIVLGPPSYPESITFRFKLRILPGIGNPLYHLMDPKEYREILEEKYNESEGFNLVLSSLPAIKNNDPIHRLANLVNYLDEIYYVTIYQIFEKFDSISEPITYQFVYKKLQEHWFPLFEKAIKAKMDVLDVVRWDQFNSIVYGETSN